MSCFKCELERISMISAILCVSIEMRFYIINTIRIDCYGTTAMALVATLRFSWYCFCIAIAVVLCVCWQCSKSILCMVIVVYRMVKSLKVSKWKQHAYIQYENEKKRTVWPISLFILFLYAFSCCCRFILFQQFFAVAINGMCLLNNSKRFDDRIKKGKSDRDGNNKKGRKNEREFKRTYAQHTQYI